MNENKHDLDDGFDPGAARALFERSVHDTETSSANRLRLARRESLATAHASPMPAWLRPVAGTAMLGAFALALALWLPGRTSAPAGTDSVDALMAAADDDQAEAFAWLGDAPVATEPGAGDSL